MKLAVVGSRSFNNAEIFNEKMNWIINNIQVDTIVSGGAKGADSLASEFAKQHDLELIEFIPEWDKYGKKAGFIRNELIWREADFGIAFWDGKSKGTKHSFELSKKYKKPLYVYNEADNSFSFFM